MLSTLGVVSSLILCCLHPHINRILAQTSYVRPLYDLLITSLAPVKEKAPKAGQGIVVQPTGLGARPRHKKKFANVSFFLAKHFNTFFMMNLFFYRMVKVVIL